MKRQQVLAQEYQDPTLFNNIGSKARSGLAEDISLLFSAGIMNASNASVSPNNMTLTVDLPSPVAFIFGDGYSAYAHGTTDGTDSSSYSVDLSSYIPASGTQEVYIVASYTTIQQDAKLISGPPQGHPDYDPNFVPYTSYNSLQDTVAVTATTTKPDNSTYIEICRTQLSSGQTSITAGSLDYSHQVIPSLKLLSSVVNTVFGKTGNVNVTPSDIKNALGYTPVNKGGDTGIGALTISGANGLTAPKLVITGNATIDGLLTSANLYATQSDSRIKKNIRPLDPDKIAKILYAWNPVSYVDIRTEENRIGFVAQELFEISPDMVVAPTYEEDEDTDGETNPKYWAVKYAAGVPYLAAGWKYHQEKIKRLENEIEELRTSIKVLYSMCNQTNESTE